MGIVFADDVRTARAQATVGKIDNGSGPGKLRLYTTPQPAKGAAVTTQTLLGTLMFGSPAGTVNAGVTTWTLLDDASADADGVAVWARITDSDDVFVADLTVTDSAGAGPVKLASTQIYAGGALEVVSAQFTEGNA